MPWGAFLQDNCPWKLIATGGTNDYNHNTSADPSHVPHTGSVAEEGKDSGDSTARWKYG